MISQMPVLHQATISVDTLRIALRKDYKNSSYDWRENYPTLAALDHMTKYRSAIIQPNDCPNVALDTYVLSELNMPLDSGLAIAEAAKCAVPAAIDDINQQNQNTWLKLTPVHWRAGRDRVHVLAFDANEIDIQETKQLLDVIEPWLADLGWHIHVVATNQWFIRSNQTFDYTSPSLAVAMSDQLEHFLPSGRDLSRWQTLMTEIQMAWFKHPVNQKREASGHLPINSIWLDNTSTSRFWTSTAVTEWHMLKESITTFNNLPIHEHLAQLDEILEPVLHEAQHRKESKLILLGESWQQDIVFKPKRRLRFKNPFSSSKIETLNWLETPQFDFIRNEST